jgi:hypothetical protein
MTNAALALLKDHFGHEPKIDSKRHVKGYTQEHRQVLGDIAGCLGLSIDPVAVALIGPTKKPTYPIKGTGVIPIDSLTAAVDLGKDQYALLHKHGVSVLESNKLTENLVLAKKLQHMHMYGGKPPKMPKSSDSGMKTLKLSDDLTDYVFKEQFQALKVKPNLEAELEEKLTTPKKKHVKGKKGLGANLATYAAKNTLKKGDDAHFEISIPKSKDPLWGIPASMKHMMDSIKGSEAKLEDLSAETAKLTAATKLVGSAAMVEALDTSLKDYFDDKLQDKLSSKVAITAADVTSISVATGANYGYDSAQSGYTDTYGELTELKDELEALQAAANATELDNLHLMATSSALQNDLEDLEAENAVLKAQVDTLVVEKQAAQDKLTAMTLLHKETAEGVEQFKKHGYHQVGKKSFDQLTQSIGSGVHKAEPTVGLKWSDYEYANLLDIAVPAIAIMLPLDKNVVMDAKMFPGNKDALLQYLTVKISKSISDHQKTHLAPKISAQLASVLHKLK